MGASLNIGKDLIRHVNITLVMVQPFFGSVGLRDHWQVSSLTHGSSSLASDIHNPTTQTQRTLRDGGIYHFVDIIHASFIGCL
jgi:hypothetical protein